MTRLQCTAVPHDTFDPCLRLCAPLLYFRLLKLTLAEGSSRPHLLPCARSAPAARPVTSPARGPATSYPKGAAANGGHGLNGQTDPDSADDRLRFLGQEDRDDAIEQRARQIRDSGIGGFYLTPWEQQPPWPWQKIKDHHFQELGIIGICAPFEDAFYIRSTMKGLFWEFKNAGLIMFGIASYEDFPGEIINPADSRHVSKDMPEIIDGMDFWLHCFRDPSAFGLPPGVPRILLSESDFVNFYRDDGGGRLMPKEGVEAPSKQYDAIYVNRGGAWNDYNRNWTVAEPSMIRLAGDLGFKIAAIDRMPSDASLSSLVSVLRRDAAAMVSVLEVRPEGCHLRSRPGCGLPTASIDRTRRCATV